MKYLLRKQYLNRRKGMLSGEVKKKSNAIREQLINSSYYRGCHSLFSYVSHDNEVDTLCIIHQAWQDGKEVYVPKVIRQGQMLFYQITSMDDLTKGKYGILEPSAKIEHAPAYDSLFIMPGVVFDKNKNRIGYGGGFYDRYLAKLDEKPMVVALGYDNQIEASLSPDPFDIKPDYILTETGWIK